jgi:hypothetical protein
VFSEVAPILVPLHTRLRMPDPRRNPKDVRIVMITTAIGGVVIAALLVYFAILGIFDLGRFLLRLAPVLLVALARTVWMWHKRPRNGD